MAAAIIPEGIQDDKAQYVIPFVLDLLKQHEEKYTSEASAPPLIVGLSASQGAGKSLLVSLLHQALVSPAHNLNTTIFSLDDFYLPYDGLKGLARDNPDNPLLQHRGQPSTHEISLVKSVFASLRENKPTKIPQFNKAAYKGFGDRIPESEWLEVNTDHANPIRVVLFEGWCVGFRPLSDESVRAKHKDAVDAANNPASNYHGRLGHNSVENVMTINNALREYDQVTSQFDGLIHIDAEDPLFVYAWRLEQEHNLIKAKGSGMSDDEVKTFIDGYYPSYELYVDGLRKGIFNTLRQDGLQDDIKDQQLRLVVGKDRKVKTVQRM